MKKIYGTFPDTQTAELACGRMKEKCEGKCEITAQNKEESDKQIYAASSQFGLSISPQTTADPGAWSSVIPVPDDESGKDGMMPCDLIYTVEDEKAEKASHILRSLGALNIHSSEA